MLNIEEITNLYDDMKNKQDMHDLLTREYLYLEWHRQAYTIFMKLKKS